MTPYTSDSSSTTLSPPPTPTPAPRPRHTRIFGNIKTKRRIQEESLHHHHHHSPPSLPTRQSPQKRPLPKPILLVFFLFLFIILPINYTLSTHLHSQPTLLSKFPTYPSFLHSDDPIQILGLPAAAASISPSSHYSHSQQLRIPSRKTTNAAFRNFNRRWHADKWARSDEATRDLVRVGYLRAVAAKEMLDAYHDTVLCRSHILRKLEEFGKGDTGPRFKRGCVCMMAVAIRREEERKWWRMVFTPWFLQGRPRRGWQGLEEWCPCDVGRAVFNEEGWGEGGFEFEVVDRGRRWRSLGRKGKEGENDWASSDFEDWDFDFFWSGWEGESEGEERF